MCRDSGEDGYCKGQSERFLTPTSTPAAKASTSTTGNNGQRTSSSSPIPISLDLIDDACNSSHQEKIGGLNDNYVANGMLMLTFFLIHKDPTVIEFLLREEGKSFFGDILRVHVVKDDIEEGETLLHNLKDNSQTNNKKDWGKYTYRLEPVIVDHEGGIPIYSSSEVRVTVTLYGLPRINCTNHELAKNFFVRIGVLDRDDFYEIRYLKPQAQSTSIVLPEGSANKKLILITFLVTND